MAMHKNINMAIGKEFKRKSLFFHIFKYLLIATGIIFLVILSFGAWIYFSLLFGPGPMEISEFHPFKSSKAKIEYLAFEGKMAKNWPVISEEKVVQTSFGKTFMRISGPVGAPPLVLLPGGGSNSYIWQANIKAFSEEYRTFALDNIYDFGRSVYTRKIESGQDFSHWLDELFDSLKLSNNIRVIGYSYGGWVVSQYALYHPERLDHVVLIAPALTILDISDKWLLLCAESLLPVRYFKEKVMYWVWKDLANTGTNGIRLVEDRIDYYEMAMKCFKIKTGVQPTVLTDAELQMLKVPLLYLVGEHETMYDGREAVNRLNKVAAHIETELIEKTGHDLLFTHTERVNKRILEYLKK